MVRDDQTLLRHMHDAVCEALEFTEGRSQQDLENDRMLGHALVRLFEIVGEAASGVSESFREKYPSLPWKQMIGMRNRLIHGYFDVDLDIVWQTVQQDLPQLREQLEAILKQQE